MLKFSFVITTFRVNFPVTIEVTIFRSVLKVRLSFFCLNSLVSKLRFSLDQSLVMSVYRSFAGWSQKRNLSSLLRSEIACLWLFTSFIEVFGTDVVFFLFTAFWSVWRDRVRKNRWWRMLVVVSKVLCSGVYKRRCFRCWLWRYAVISKRLNVRKRSWWNCLEGLLWIRYCFEVSKVCS